MRYSYAWDMDVTDFWKRVGDDAHLALLEDRYGEMTLRHNESLGYGCYPDQTLNGRHVEVRGIFYSSRSERMRDLPGHVGVCDGLVADDGIGFDYIEVLGLPPEDTPPDGTPLTVKGRASVAWICLYVAVDVTASRFTGASIAGLVVGAMGVFVFAVALRHWVGERRAFRQAA